MGDSRATRASKAVPRLGDGVNLQSSGQPRHRSQALACCARGRIAVFQGAANVGHSFAVVEGEHVDTGIASKPPRDEEKFTLPGVSRNIGRGFGHDNGQLALAKLAKAHQVCQRQSLPACMAGLAGISLADRQGDAGRQITSIG